MSRPIDSFRACGLRSSRGRPGAACSIMLTCSHDEKHQRTNKWTDKLHNLLGGVRGAYTGSYVVYNMEFCLGHVEEFELFRKIKENGVNLPYHAGLLLRIREGERESKDREKRNQGKGKVMLHFL